jgi:hypothetical protein
VAASHRNRAARDRLATMQGEIFGRWTVIKQAAYRGNGMPWMKCRCICGTVRDVRLAEMRNGMSRSCGCIRIEAISTHRMTRSPEFKAWNRMKNRCYCKSTAGFHRYGGRGITVCKRWRNSFESFLADMGPRPSSKHSLDRKNNDRGYCPSNCRWATREEQGRNKSSCRFLRYKGRSLTIAGWSEVTGLSHGAICARLRLGWPVARTLTEPINVNCHSRRTRSTRRTA